MKGERVADIVRRLAEPITAEMGLELVEVEYRKESGGWFLRVTIDKPDGVDLDDCSLVSRKLGDKLDEVDPIPQQYHLEVSSPGLDRPLKTERDFRKFIGETIDIHVFAPINGQKIFTGCLTAYHDGLVSLEFPDGSTAEIPLAGIAKANLHPVF